MKKNALIIIVATIMMFSSLAVGLEVSVTGSNNQFQVAPQASHGKTDIGNVTIYANGTVSNSSVVQQVGTTNTYSLLTNINGTLYINRNNTVLEGNGLTLTGGSASNDPAAVVSLNTTGVTVRDIVVGNSSYYGLQFGNANNAVIDNISTVDFSGHTLLQVYYSSNVTLEGSNLSFSSAYVGVGAEYDTSLNVSGNHLEGSASVAFVNFEFSGTLNAYNNVILSTNSASRGIVEIHSGSSNLGWNIFNDTYYGLEASYAGAVSSSHNYVSNSSGGAFFVSYSTSFTSKGDIAIYGQQPVFIQDVGSTVIVAAQFSNFTSSLGTLDYGTFTMSDSQISTATSTQGLNLNEGGNVNLIGDSINMGNSSSRTAIYTFGVTGILNIANTNIYVPNGAGLLLYHSPLINVTDSSINASFGINDLSSAVSRATVTNNNFNIGNNGYALDLGSQETVFNVNFSNNKVDSPGNHWAYSGIYLNPNFNSGNIIVSHNSFLNNKYPVFLSETGLGLRGSNVLVQGNSMVNSDEAIQDMYYINSTISSNTIINATNDGIYVFGSGPNTNISGNLVENMPGFGGMADGITLEGASGGTNIISHNVVLNEYSKSFSGNGIYLTQDSGTVMAFSNVVNNSFDGFYLGTNNNLHIFGNTVFNATNDGVVSVDNTNASYYSNTISDANTSLYSGGDANLIVFANTFMNAQRNDPNVQFLQLNGYNGVTFYHNNFLNDTFNSTTSYVVLASSFPLFMNMPLPVGGNYYSNYTGTGADGIGSTPMNLTGTVQDMYPLLYKWTSPTVTFLETGLPSGTMWSVKLGSNLQEVSGTSAVFQQANGQYTSEPYSVMNVPGYTASTSSGTVSMHGESNVETINFTPVTYGVTFTESGLSNNSWSVTLNGNTQTTTGTSIGFSIGNGTYDYTIGSVSGYSATTASGSVTISGASKNVAVQFNPLEYNLTITQTGLPSGDTWTATIGGNSYTSTNSSIVVSLSAGTYNVTVTGPSGYTVTLPSNNVTVSNPNQTFSVTFSRASGVSSTVLYGGIGAAAFFGGAAGALATMFYTGSGIFRKPED